jgi:hypothetical protein
MRSLLNYRYFLSIFFLDFATTRIKFQQLNKRTVHKVNHINILTFHNFAYFSFILLLSLEVISLLVMLYLCSYKFCLKRRLRIRTLQYRPASNISEIYDSVDPEVVLHILVHKVNLC